MELNRWNDAVGANDRGSRHRTPVRVEGSLVIMAIRHPEKHHFQVSPNYQADATSASFGPTRAFLKKQKNKKTTEISKSDSENLFFFFNVHPASWTEDS